MNIPSFSHDKIMEGLKFVDNTLKEDPSDVRLLFTPKQITDQNFDEVCRIYAGIQGCDFDTVVVIESHPGSAEKKLPMPSFKYLDTKLGRVYANDKLRNDFADEDDDFFLNDEAFDEEAGLWHQLMMLQSTLNEFTVLSIQITDENSFIVKELAYAIEEILAAKNALIICCCDLPEGSSDELRRVLEYLEKDNVSAILNYLNGDTSTIDGVGSFITGLLVAKKWGLKLEFPALNKDYDISKSPALGYASLQKQSIFQT